MKVNRVDALIFSSSNIKVAAEFYKQIGFDLVEEQHGDGPVHYACQVGDCHLALFEAKEGKAPAQEFGGSTKVGFNVDDVDAAFEKALQAGGVSKLPPDNAPWGRNAVVIDPDGRTIELNGPSDAKNYRG